MVRLAVIVQPSRLLTHASAPRLRAEIYILFGVTGWVAGTVDRRRAVDDAGGLRTHPERSARDDPLGQRLSVPNELDHLFLAPKTAPSAAPSLRIALRIGCRKRRFAEPAARVMRKLRCPAQVGSGGRERRT